MNKSYQTAALGLGSMGYGMAQSILSAGHIVFGFNVKPKRTDSLKAEGDSTGSFDDIAYQLDFVAVVVLNAA